VSGGLCAEFSFAYARCAARTNTGLDSIDQEHDEMCACATVLYLAVPGAKGAIRTVKESQSTAPLVESLPTPASATARSVRCIDLPGANTPMSRRTFTAIGGTVAIAVLLTAGLSAHSTEKAEAAPGKAATLTTIKVADVLQAAKIQIASDNGFFKKHGLKVDLTKLATGTEIIAAVQGGSVDIGYADTFAGINAIKNGFDISLIAPGNGSSKWLPYVVKADSPIKTVKDLEGKSLGLGAVTQFVVNANGFLNSQGADPSKVTFSLLKQTSGLAEALQNGTVDAIQSDYPTFLSNQGQAGAYDFRLVGSPATTKFQSPDATTAGFWSTTAWAKSHRKVESEFDAAILAYDRWYTALSADKKSALSLKYYNIDLIKIAGGSKSKLNYLTQNDNLATKPFNLAATNKWIALGNRYAPTQVPLGVDLKSHIFPSAKQK
jgi:NitT/TauT family transport system substrate-binding protein